MTPDQIGARIVEFACAATRDNSQPVLSATTTRANLLGGQFLTQPQRRDGEIRCYLRDPDRYLIEVGQTTRS